ncbi:ATPase [Candidatus Izimaplasma bacterium ZiA1]|uniref:cation-translocating P-type ATPase n=1 Tax=Candidatus Izimoplasma sp. ZiA1 TaxID=2024899 RepID=UPI000BAA7E41|nr:ATPase [Candidatus Izimaplasma bacterium ZiA1]
MKYYSKSINDVLNELKTTKDGLSTGDFNKRKEIHGLNQLTEKKSKSIYKMIYEQVTEFLNLLLIVAAVISMFASHSLSDGLFIIAIVILNVSLSVFQERKASNAVNALKQISAPHAKVIRNNEVISVDSKMLTIGDIVLFEAGDYIPADIRIIESINLKIDESALTGESLSVDKIADTELKENSPLGDRINMAYMSTIVTYGRGTGVVTNIGMGTEIGNIANLLNEVEDELTPLQKKIDKLGKLLGIISVVVVIIIFIVGLLYGMDVLDIFLVSVSLAVAAIPEGLPTVITVVLALGMRKMAGKNAIVKSLSAVETLGSTTVISSDKTGTLTQNKMVVTRIFDNTKIIEVTGNGYKFEGEIKGDNQNIDLITQIGFLCNDSKINKDNLIGDPTELALITLGHKNKLEEKYNSLHPRIDEYPFDSDRKLMSVYVKYDDSNYLYTKGAPDQLLKKCTHALIGGEKIKIDEKFKKTLLLANQGMARSALRVLGFAYKELNKYDNLQEEEENLILAGLVGIIDPPREEVKEAIKICHKAGIRVVMITGDHKITATAIGKELGIIKDESGALSGDELDKLSREELLEKIKVTNVFARVSPNHKVDIVKALQEVNEITSMTGDGVNDAPALKQANIGVAMGITGTDVSKEAADMVLMDDNFTTIVEAVEEGRVIFANIRKFVGYLVSCNVGEVLLIFIAMLLGFGSPLFPIQILWINLVTDSFPAFALGLEQKEEGVMDKDPIDPNQAIVDRKMGIAIAFQSIFLAVAVLTSFLIGSKIVGGEFMGETFAFITIITGELLRTYSARSESKTIFKMNIFSNKLVNLSVAFGFVLLVLVVFVPGVNDLFSIAKGLTFNNIVVALSLGLIPLFGGELAKLFK